MAKSQLKHLTICKWLAEERERGREKERERGREGERGREKERGGRDYNKTQQLHFTKLCKLITKAFKLKLTVAK